MPPLLSFFRPNVALVNLNLVRRRGGFSHDHNASSSHILFLFDELAVQCYINPLILSEMCTTILPILIFIAQSVPSAAAEIQ
jgi:hypothetical protein